jgi:RNA polymerase sigma-70 factor, ECF subfamily
VPSPTGRDAGRAVDAVWRIESARVIAGLARLVGDVGIAEDLAQDALVAALEQWPSEGVPDNPGAWLMAVGKRRAVDQFRRNEVRNRKYGQLAQRTDLQRAEFQGAEFQVAEEAAEDLGDDLLTLVFLTCHPTLAPEARVALTLRLFGGLSTEEIARAFLVRTTTLAQRIVRAKRTLAEARVPFALPPHPELAERLASVLEVLYLVFNEGYSATAGDDWTRPELCHDAVRLGRIVAELLPEEPEVHGLVALMELQASRLGARVGRSGEAVLLLDQDRSRWDRLLIRRGEAALQRAARLGRGLGPYGLQAAIAVCHARAAAAADTDWVAIAALYDALAQVAPSPVVELNRAVALGMAFGPAAGLEVLDALANEPAMVNYHLLPSVRGDLLEKLGHWADARAEFERAASLTRNGAERQLLLRRADQARHGGA